MPELVVPLAELLIGLENAKADLDAFLTPASPR